MPSITFNQGKILYRLPGYKWGATRLHCSASRGAGSSRGANGIPLTPPTGGFNGDRMGNLTIRQEFFRIFDQGVKKAFPHTLYAENSLLFDTILELESQGYKAIAALGALMHLSTFYCKGEKLNPREVVNEIFDPNNWQENSAIIQQLAQERFLIPTTTSPDEDLFSQILTSYKELSAAANRKKAEAPEAFLHCENIIILLIIRVDTGGCPMESVITLFTKPTYLAELGGRKGLEHSKELEKKAIFEILMGMVERIAAINGNVPIEVPPSEIEAMDATSNLFKLSSQPIVKTGLRALPQQIRELSIEMIDFLSNGDFYSASAIANKIREIIYEPIILS